MGPARESLPGEGAFFVSCQRGLETRALGQYESLERSSGSQPSACELCCQRSSFMVLVSKLSYLLLR